MDTIRTHISFVKTLIEDPSLQPQHTIAYTNKMIYFSLLIAKDSYAYETRINPNIKYKTGDTEYFIPCFPMNEVEVVECPCEPVSGCTWMKSKWPLPDFKGNKLVMVSPLNVGHSDDYGFVEWDDLYDLRRSRRPDRLTQKYTIRNISGQKFLYIHTFSKVKPQNVSLLGPFDDLLQVSYLIENGCSSGPLKTVCNFLDKPFDLQNNQRDKIYLKAFQIVKTMEDKNIIPDRQTDDKDGSKFIQDRSSN